MIVALIKTLRPRQWVKNVFVAVPLFFALRLFDGVALARTAVGVALFCLISGCVYVLNDLVDAPQDRLHPQKRSRPIASGALPVGVARTFLVIAVPVCAAAAFLLSPQYAAVLSTYFVLNIAYTFRLKKIAYLDVLTRHGWQNRAGGKYPGLKLELTNRETGTSVVAAYPDPE